MKQLTYHFCSESISNTTSAPNPGCPLIPGFVLLYREQDSWLKDQAALLPRMPVRVTLSEGAHIYNTYPHKSLVPLSFKSNITGTII